MLTKILKEVPDEVFFPALKEVQNIDWGSIRDTSRAVLSWFNDSTSLSLRTHMTSNLEKKPTTMSKWGRIVECEDTPSASEYPILYDTAKWIYNQVEGKRLGKIYIVHLKPGGLVKLHTDPLDYFEIHSRFHIPFRTNEKVLFSSGPETPVEHMPYKHLCQLNNRSPHMLVNGSDDYRIHMIVDVEVEGRNQIF
jgi:hypothetical protein